MQNPATSQNLSGWLNGFIGVVIFSGSLPATKVAVLEFDPVFLTLARATIAGAIALCVLLLLKAAPSAKPAFVLADRGHRGCGGLSTADRPGAAACHFCSLDCVFGLLPLATAAFGVLRGGERPRPAFWLFSILGSALVVTFALSQGLTASPQATF